MSPSRVGVFADDAPVLRPGVYTPAIIANGFVFTSGVLGADPMTKKMVDGTMVDRFHQIMRNLKQILEKAGSGIEHVVEVSVFLTDIDDADALSPAYVQYWGDLMPARTCVAVKQLPYGSDIEIKCVAVQASKET
ncbi:Endoribonuclease L-PSP/chorismate mutase-like protein [Plectosphaerella cucumerina]|uniref:Endoribonuclease L-PSP/chorismate mutase-like protein n=1 Tax=Plectosphaerella cucumerina TaxID=40658 RepID=A0A8K0TM00_9PEZI|nr:Endoribonuclease L-PSP/chorismate mutase-like protein [Plectosphaerella cucumerina]